ncbi:MAG: extracellular solute-binding protein [Acetobacteraceae bacterium]
MDRRGFLAGGLAAALPQVAGAADDRAALVEAARREGEVSYWDAVIQPETNDELVAAFRKQTGLGPAFRVNYTLLSTANLVTRVEQELAAGRVTADVAAVASPSWAFEKADAGHALEYDSPEYANYTGVFERGLGRRGFFVFNGGYMFIPMWNTENQAFAGRSWTDVLGKATPGRLSIGDAANSAAHLATFIGLRSKLGDGYFREVAKLRPTFLVRSEQIAGRLVDGQDLLTLAGQPTRALQNNERGAALKFLFPEEGVVLMPQCMFILKRAPHPNAAKLWIDFILSVAGQTILAKREAMSSGRTGFESPVPDYAPNIAQMRLIDVDWRGLKVADLERARADWRQIFNP